VAEPGCSGIASWKPAGPIAVPGSRGRRLNRCKPETPMEGHRQNPDWTREDALAQTGSHR